MNSVFMGIGSARGVDVRKWRSSERVLGGARGMGQLSEETARRIANALAQAERGELDRSEGLRLLALIGPEVDKVCREFGDDSERCTNMKVAYARLVGIVGALPVSIDSSYGTGTVVVVGLVGALLGFAVGWVAK